MPETRYPWQSMIGSWQSPLQRLEKFAPTIASLSAPEAREALRKQFSGPLIGGGAICCDFEYDTASRQAILTIACYGVPPNMPGQSGQVIVGIG